MVITLILALLAVVDAGVQTYRQGGNFAYAFTTQQHQAVPLLYQRPASASSLPESFPQINYAYTIEANHYSKVPYSPYLYQQLLFKNDDNKLFAPMMGDETENESKWFTSNPINTAHSLPTSTNSVSASALASTSNSVGSTGIPSFSSASNAVFQYPFLTLFHRLFSRPSINRPNRPATAVSSAPPLMRPVLNSINDSIIIETLNLMSPFARPRPWNLNMDSLFIYSIILVNI